MKILRWACLLGWAMGCGGAEFTAPDDAGGGGNAGASTSSSSSSSSTTSAATSTTSASSTTSGSGGSGGTGGGGTGGQSVDAQADAPVSCDAAMPSPVKFRMKSAAGGDYCINNCAGLWVTIVGGTKPVTLTHGCVTTCEQCTPIACDIACVPPQHVKPEGETFTWDGTMWEQSKCGPQMFACVNQVCSVPPGRYTARMCANRATGDGGTGFCTSDPTPTCVDVPFDYPTSATVEGTLP